MHSKSTLVIILVLVVGVAVWYFATAVHIGAPAPIISITATSTHPTPGVPQQATSSSSSGRLSSVTPISTSTATVSGVDVSTFNSQANQSAAWSSQDGTSDAQSMSGDDTTLNSGLDEQGNTVK